jgi:hypothetical protein
MKNGPYELVVAPKNFPGKKYRGKYCYEHHLVYWKEYGVVPEKDEIIHHKDEEHHNNKIDNLELIKKKDHDNWHAFTKRKHMELECSYCGNMFTRDSDFVNDIIKQGSDDYYCSELCENLKNRI